MNSTHDTKEPTSFAHLTKEVVRTFLETAVVLDDGAFMSPPTVVEDVNEPNTNSDSGDPDSDSDATPIADSDDQPSNSLDAQALMTNFATHGMVCSVLAPWKDDDGTHPTVNVSRRADIVILDWELEDDQGEQATRIIREILDHDASAGGRLRLIAVYTAHQRLDPIRDAVANHLPAFVPHDRTATARSLETDHARVVFIKKGPTSTVSGSVLEPDLPGRLVDDFVDMARGLLANVAFGCIAALRAHTHQLLARFPARLDGPYLSHRILLKTPEDAEQYAVDLLNSEITELLRHGPIASTYAGNSAIRLTLSQAIADGTQPRLMLAKNADTDTKPLSLDDVMKLVEQGPPGLGGIDGLTANRSQMENLHHKVDLLLAPDLASGRAGPSRFRPPQFPRARTRPCTRRLPRQTRSRVHPTPRRRLPPVHPTQMRRITALRKDPVRLRHVFPRLVQVRYRRQGARRHRRSPQAQHEGHRNTLLCVPTRRRHRLRNEFQHRHV